MTERLLLSQVQANPFGGRDFGLSFGSHDFVVIHGDNETGKSSMAELISWLLVGPAGDAANAQRFAPVDSIIGGHIEGRLGGAPFSSSGNFRVGKSGAPSARRLAARVDDTEFSLVDWRRRLGGIDAAVFSAIYRLWGQDLFVGDGEHRQLAKIALGALGTAGDPRAVIDALAQQVASCTKSKAASAVSVAKLQPELTAIDEHLRDAMQTAERFGAYEREMASLEGDAAGLRSELADVQRQIKAIEMVRTATQLHQTALDAETELSQLEAVPDPWRALVSRADASTICTELIDTREAVRRAQEALAAHLQTVGVELVDLDVSTATMDDVGAIGKRVSEVDTADHAVVQARSGRGRAEQQLDNARRRTDAALALAPRLDRTSLDTGMLAGKYRTDLVVMTDGWSSARGALEQAELDLRRAEDDEARAVDAVHRSEAAWDRYGTGVTAQQWRPNGATGGSPAAGLTSAVAAAVVVALVAGVAALLGQWLVAGLAVAAAAAVFLLLWRQRVPVGAGGVADEQLLAATEAVRSARQRLDDCAGAVMAARDREAQARDAVAKCRNQLARFGARYGLAVADTPAESAHIRDLAFDAAEALAAEQALAAALDDAGSVLNAAQEDRARAFQAFVGALGAIGIAPCEPDRALALVQAHATGRERQVKVRLAQGALERAQGAFADLVGPLGAEAAAQEPTAVRDRLEQYVRVAGEREDLEGRAAQAAAAANRALGDNELAMALFHERHDAVALDALNTQASQRAEEIGSELSKIDERRGEIKFAAEQLSSADRIADLHLQRGSIEEQRRDLALEAAARGVAAVVLRQVADEYEKNHQPQIIRRAGELARAVAPEWGEIIARRIDGTLELLVEQRGVPLPAQRLSTGARTLLYTALRLAMAEHDAETRQVLLPLICDDSAAHLDDERAARVVGALAQVSRRHQVLLFTCHTRTAEEAVSLGATVVRLGA